MGEKEAPVVQTQLLIRKPVAIVFEAFVNPRETTKFWFTKSSGRLENGATIRWEWETYGVGTDVQVIAIEPNKRIRIEWDDPPCPVEWRFTPQTESTTLVQIENWGFEGDNKQRIGKAIDAMQGFTMVLAGAKSWLEHGIQLKLIEDHFPEETPDES